MVWICHSTKGSAIPRGKSGLTRKVCAINAYLCDTLCVARGADEIETYFLKTTSRVNTMTMSILGYSPSGNGGYSRWTLTISAEELSGGRSVATYGMSHFQFDWEVKVFLQQDFRDACAGFFCFCPGPGRCSPAFAIPCRRQSGVKRRGAPRNGSRITLQTGIPSAGEGTPARQPMHPVSITSWDRTP